MRRVCTVLLLVLVSFGRAPAFGQGPVNFTRTFETEGQSLNVSFRAWAPVESERVRGVLFYLPGSGGNTRGVASNAGWQDVVRQMGFAIVGVQYTTLPDGNPAYLGSDATSGAANMQSLLDGMAAGLGRPEIRNAPLLPFGTSAGGFQASFVASVFSERVLGFMADKGAYPLAPASPSQAHVPGLFVYGNSDEQVDPYFIDLVYQGWRLNGGEAAKTVDWAGHIDVSNHLRDAFIQQVVKERYPVGQVPSLVPGNPLELVDIPLSQGWRGEIGALGDPVLGTTPIAWPTIAPANEFGSGEESASWLLNETMARVYRAHIARPVGIDANALTINAYPTNWGTVPMKLVIDMPGVAYTGIDVYDDTQLIAHLDYSDDFHTIVYQPTENGMHTFIAIAEYSYGGETHFASEYTTFNVNAVGQRLIGDYNGDNVVDAADYTVWRNSYGLEDIDLPADGSGNTVVDEADYELWRRNYGQTFPLPGGGSLAGGTPSVPEPPALLLAGWATVGGLFRRRHQSD